MLKQMRLQKETLVCTLEGIYGGKNSKEMLNA